MDVSEDIKFNLKYSENLKIVRSEKFWKIKNSENQDTLNLGFNIHML